MTIEQTTPVFVEPKKKTAATTTTTVPGKIRRLNDPTPPKETDVVDIDPADFVGSSEDWKVSTRWVDLSNLVVDDRYQRGPETTEINDIANNWDPRAVGTLTVALRRHADGTQELVLLDGQQRTLAGIQAGHTALVKADVHENLTLGEEAALFLLLNKRRAVNAATRFKAAVVAGKAEEVTVQDILDRLGIRAGAGHGLFAAFTKSITLVQRRDGAYHLEWALRMARDLFADKDDRHVSPYDNRVVEALFLFHNRYDGLFSQKELERKLQGKTPSELVIRGNGSRDINRGRIAPNIAAVIVGWYNRGKKTLGGKMLEPYPVVARPATYMTPALDVDDDMALLPEGDDAE